ncbi:MAG: type II toxin-antitoxin system Phd/YefM family antitoxin [Polyangiaceae bacterium]
MKRISVAEAKAHFSDVVAEARRGKKIVILRHGKPAAAVVPVSMVESTPKLPVMTREEALAVFESFAPLGDPSFDAVADLKLGRR